MTNIIAEQDFTQEMVQAARAVTLKSLSEIYILVTPNTKDIAELDAFTPFVQDYEYKAARGVMDLYPQRPSYVIVANASKSVIKVAKNPRIATTSPSYSEILHIKSDEFSPYLPPSNPDDSVNIVYYKPAPTVSNKWRNVTRSNKMTTTASMTAGEMK